MNKKRVIQRTAAAAGCIIIVLCAVILLRPKTGELVLINDAHESVLRAAVEINGAKYEFTDIPPDETRKMKYKVAAGNQYTVSVEFRYDRKLVPQEGAFSDKVKTHQLVIKHNEVVLESGED